MTPAITALLLAVFPFSAAIADETVFLDTLSGNWHGSGQVRLNPGAVPLAVSCSLDSRADGAALNLAGACRAKVVFSRRIGVDLRANGTRYTGSYVGSRRGAARLVGTRTGATLNLQIIWPDKGTSSRVASMRLASVGTGHMQIVTIEPHPQTGEQVITAKIELTRN
ncbi:hypothetical protein [Aminobacter aminovorans]|uniref:hypothetical protein n=1 Tax=Aminobacter aminovorans TaxID=83263 RepID=UPI002857A1AD|nr:hypothetical protein [Aminobacter aminovorans]MDR7220169.1 hypothetical protein [Aminobacter aminovorans]